MQGRRRSPEQHGMAHARGSRAENQVRCHAGPIEPSRSASRKEVGDAIEAGALSPWEIPGLGPKTISDLCDRCRAAIPMKAKAARIPSDRAIEHAKQTLERAGYVVLPPTA